MTLFPKIKDMPIEEQKIARQNLLKYCELDTYAMVKVWEELVRVAEQTGQFEKEQNDWRRLECV